MAAKESMIGAALIVLGCEVGMIISNILIRFKNINYINYAKVLKTLCFMIFISIMSFVTVMVFDNVAINKTICVLKIVMFITINYSISMNFRKYLLE